MRSNAKPDLNDYDVLVPERIACEELASGVTFRTFPHVYFDQGRQSLVNVYTLEVDGRGGARFGLQFSSEGDYCAALTARAQRASAGRVLCAMTCNFGLMVGSTDLAPKDLSFNLHLENGRLVQLPVADKTALFVDPKGELLLSTCRARGYVRIGDQRLPWIGSLAKTPADTTDAAAVVYNSFNRGLLVSQDQLTGTRRSFDPRTSHTPCDPSRVDLLIDSSGTEPVVGAMNLATRSHLFSAHMILSVPRVLAEKLRVGDVLRDVTLGEFDLQHFASGATVGAILTRNRTETEQNIAQSEIVQTRSAETGKPIYGSGSKFCRGCLVQTPSLTVLLLIDARREVRGQEGMTIAQLRAFIETVYPDYERAANLDGGHAAKLAIARPDGIDVFGNLHFKLWPKSAAEPFRWHGYLGARVPGVIFVYR